MEILMNILYVLLFILCLSILIMIHELGHFTAAKIFKVYVQEYSIGFGPALIHKRRKGTETYFSLRVIPFGGYVSMYGEGVELEDGVQVDQSRSLEGIKKWKRAIILVAGVTMNAVLALHLFFIYNVAFKQEMCYYNCMQVEEGSKAAEAGLKTLDVIALDSFIDTSEKNYAGDKHIFDMDTLVTYSDDTTETVYSYLDLSEFKNYKDLTFTKFLAMYSVVEKEGGQKVVDYTKPVDLGAKFKYAIINIKTLEYNEADDTTSVVTHNPIVVEKNAEGKLQDFGYSLYLKVDPPLSFGKAIGQSFVDFGNSSTAIFRAFATLFTKETWSQVGGIVAIGFQSTSILQNFGLGKFIYVWGALSVNLALINLFPFPGLDGWQLLVLAVEAIFRKKIPNKVKTIVSIVGLVLLFAFMGVLLFKDLFTYIF